jgi:transcription initiation factor IIE alpha subunit
MTTDCVDIPCPRCGEKHSFTKAEITTQAKLEFTCNACWSKITIINEIPGVDELDKNIERLGGKNVPKH